MMTIHKFVLNKARTEIELPQGARVLHTEIQRGMPCIWALLNPAEPKEKRTFRLVATGEEIDARPMVMAHNNEPVYMITTETSVFLHYVGTIMTLDQALVFHVFEEK